MTQNAASSNIMQSKLFVLEKAYLKLKINCFVYLECVIQKFVELKGVARRIVGKFWLRAFTLQS